MGVSEELTAYLEAKKVADYADSRLKGATRALIEAMHREQRKTVKAKDEDGIAQVTYVSRTTYNIDEKALRKELTAKVYDKYTTKKLDRNALQAAMDTGEVSPVIVAKHVREVQGNPYLKLSHQKEEEMDA